jgi:hypothetical protein
MKEKKKDFKTVLFEGLGTASMAWSEIPKGIFDSTLASKIGDDIMATHLSERDKFAMEYNEWRRKNISTWNSNYILNSKNYGLASSKDDYLTEHQILDLFKAQREGKG